MPSGVRYARSGEVHPAVAALTQNGEMLASSTVRDLVVGSGIDVERRRGHGRRGVPGESRPFAVVNP
jgi:hypothetical protein